MSRCQMWPPLVAFAVALATACGPSAPPPLPGENLPGAAPFDAPTLARLGAAWAARPAGYTPRTRHVLPDGVPRYTNRLFLEPSPYLQQHAHNPVNWYPWGDEAFETARRLGRPVLLSVGYSTCHWCHVMEEESFEDDEIARYLNEHYVVIKVDREERPDIDAVYMNAVQTLTGGGGWPMTVWLTAERRPFYGGTYYPARDGDRGVRVGFATVLRTLATAFAEQPARVTEAAGSLTEQVRANLEAESGDVRSPDPSALHAAMASSRRIFDPEHGGASGAPKFPSSLPVRFLLRHHRRTGDADALHMATYTLERMAAGGIHDHVGGGFHRYATDARWLVPHFEKMLYDNARLTLAYLEAHQATGRDDFADVARDILRDVDRDMTAPAGGFYSATDADSVAPDGRREEGRFFTWTPAEIREVLDADAARLVEAHYGVTVAGDFEGRSILNVATPLAALATALGLEPGSAAQLLATSRDRLRAARARRPLPLRDEKVLAAWNGLMISAHARAAVALGEDAWVGPAAAAATFVLTAMRPDGRLRRSWKDGEARQAAYLEDYAFLIAGLLDLFEATGDPHWLSEAIALDRVLAAHYEDTAAGGFFMTSDDHEALLAREKPVSDGAEPSGNSVQALNLLRLHDLTTDDSYRLRAERAVAALGGALVRAPLDSSELLLALDYQLDTPKEIVVVAPRSRAEAAPFLDALRTRFLPNRVLTVVAGSSDVARLVPLVADKIAVGGKPTAYVCERRVCDLPTTDPAVFARQIARVQPLPPDAASGGS